MTAKPAIAAILLAGFGLARWPLEDAATRDFRHQRILPPQAGISLRQRLTQNSYAGVLGGARSLVASLQELAAFVAWEDQDWGQVENKYRLITDLQPTMASYWDTGSWHLAYNAAGFYRYDWPGPKGETNPLALQRVKMDLWTRYVRKGQDLLADGVRNNPDDWHLLAAAGRLWSDPMKLPDPAQAAESFRLAAAAPGAPARMLRRFEAGAISLVPGREEEARAKLQALYDEDPRNRTPNLVCTLFDFQLAAGVPEARRVPLAEIGPRPGMALEELVDYAKARRLRGRDISRPLYEFIARMEAEAGVPPPQRLPPPVQKP